MPSYSESELNELRPVLGPGVEREDLGDGIFCLNGPLFKRGPIRGWYARTFKLPQRLRCELDEVGSFVIQRVGERNMGQLADDLADHLKLTRREAEGALGLFFKDLIKRKLIDIVRPDAASGPGEAA